MSEASKNQISGSEAVIKSLIAEGVDIIFGYPGGAIMPIYDALWHYKDKINHAKYIIATQYQNPPTLSILAKEIGMNECKLKQGFKEVFDTTVFGYVTQLRMDMALQLLRDTDQTAKEIAYSLGYSSPQHFNNAFKKQFGITPHVIRQTP